VLGDIRRNAGPVAELVEETLVAEVVHDFSSIKQISLVAFVDQELARSGKQLRQLTNIIAHIG
jgi:hypothetical protein